MVGLGSLALISSSRALSFICLSRSLPSVLCTPVPTESSRRFGIYTASASRSERATQLMASSGRGSGRRKAVGLSASSPAVAAQDGKGNITLEMPKWFKSERVRCLTDATTPRDEGRWRCSKHDTSLGWRLNDDLVGLGTGCVSNQYTGSKQYTGAAAKPRGRGAAAITAPPPGW